MSSVTKKARSSLLKLLVVLMGLAGFLAYGVYAKDESWTPGLALDLAGGTEIILSPVSESGAEVTEDVLQQAVEVIRKRIDGTGVAEAEITTQGVEYVLVSLPGSPSQQTLELVTEAAQLQFRPVLYSGGPSETILPPGLDIASDPLYEITKDTKSSYIFITDEVRERWAELDCTLEGSSATVKLGNSTAAFVACSNDEEPLARYKYILGPVEMFGDDISQASSGPSVNQGGVSAAYEVRLGFTTKGRGLFENVTRRLKNINDADPSNFNVRDQFAMVLDGQVISAPQSHVVIDTGNARITRDFPPMTQEETSTLANQLKYGALPLDFETVSKNSVSATLGTDQLQKGLLAGGIGLILVVLYSLLQYRALAAVTVGSLFIAAALTMGVIGAFSHLVGYRLSLAGVTGLIVAIGITADSFIVYFERIRDELRDGRSLSAAVDHGWSRARRTILASDAVSLLAAVALYMTAVGNVRGFAFTLGLTTIIDLMVVTMFTHPILVLLAKTHFFASGHRLSGLDPRLLGKGLIYKGRGRVEVGAPTIAERKAGLKGGGS
ncbi:MAG: protein translocase subunit SecD [Demequinaceae bacterium]|nr:protein translocase subunit SecD [Demequinaceae bacterium]